MFWSYLGDKFHALSLLFSQCGIIHLTYCPYIYEQNGLNERKYKQIFYQGLAILGQASLSLTFWDMFLYANVFLLNRLPIPILDHLSSPEKTILYQIKF